MAKRYEPYNFSIKAYLYSVMEDFRRDYSSFYDRNHEISFENSTIPMYADPAALEHYLLRFSYAYCFYYTRMYMDILKGGSFSRGQRVKVASLGCGDRIDYMGLCIAEQQDVKEMSFVYSGIDRAYWPVKYVRRRAKDFISPLKTGGDDILDFLRKGKNLDCSIYSFPMSLSELDNAYLAEICNVFSSKPVLEDEVFLAAVTRENGALDEERLERLAESLVGQGFRVTDRYSSDYERDMAEGTLISACSPYSDLGFGYPSKLYQELLTLNRDSGLRMPMMHTGYIRYDVLKLERGVR